MVNIQEQVQIGFRRISSEIRSLSSSVPPQPQIDQEHNYRKSIEHNYQKSIEKDNEINDFEYDEQEEDIEEINPIYEDSFSDRGIEYNDHELQEEAQKELVKRKRKEIRVIVIMLTRT